MATCWTMYKNFVFSHVMHNSLAMGKAIIRIIDFLLCHFRGDHHWGDRSDSSSSRKSFTVERRSRGLLWVPPVSAASLKLSRHPAIRWQHDCSELLLVSRRFTEQHCRLVEFLLKSHLYALVCLGNSQELVNTSGFDFPCEALQPGLHSIFKRVWGLNRVRW